MTRLSRGFARVVIVAAIAVSAWLIFWFVVLGSPEVHGQAACRTIDAPSALAVNLADDLNAEAIEHVRDSVARGQPRVVHWDPAGADARRDASLRGFPTWGQLSLERRKAIDPEHFGLAHDRDEYPPAASREGGAGADVAYILSADNRSAGSRMRSQVEDYCVGTAFLLEP